MGFGFDPFGVSLRAAHERTPCSSEVTNAIPGRLIGAMSAALLLGCGAAPETEEVGEASLASGSLTAGYSMAASSAAVAFAPVR